MRIGVDLDGVCYQWDKTARYMLREILPASPYAKDGPLGVESTSWDYIEQNVAKGDWKWLWKQGVELGLFRHGHLYPGTIKALRALDKIGNVVAVTSRPEKAIEDTMAWIAFHKLPLREVVVLHGGRKSETRECAMYLDDKPENCTDLVEGWPESYICLMDRPWNQGTSPHGVSRIVTWDDYVSIAKALKERRK